jgi:hypothetical protein
MFHLGFRISIVNRNHADPSSCRRPRNSSVAGDVVQAAHRAATHELRKHYGIPTFICLTDCRLEADMQPEVPATSHLDTDFRGFLLLFSKC